MTIPNAQYINELVAVRYDQPIPKVIKLGGKSIVFMVKLGISLALVDEADVPPLLRIRGGCCNKERYMVKLASFEAANLWRTGTRDGIIKSN